MSHRQTFTLCILMLWMAAARAESTLEYQVAYKGVFSAGATLRIADVRLGSRHTGGKSGLLETRMEASSAEYPMIERLFPIRYRFRNWTETGDASPLLGFETYQHTRRHRHRLYLPDDSELGVRRYDLLRGAGMEQMTQLEAGVVPSTKVSDGRLLDRLGMLQRLRRQALQEHSEFHFDVTNGREWLKYRVRVEAAQVLQLDGVSVPAWKIRFDGAEPDRRGDWQPAHRPLYLWLSQAPGPIPLRVDARHGIGLFRIELKNAAGVERLAYTGS